VPLAHEALRAERAVLRFAGGEAFVGGEQPAAAWLVDVRLGLDKRPKGVLVLRVSGRTGRDCPDPVGGGRDCTKMKSGFTIGRRTCFHVDDDRSCLLDIFNALQPPCTSSKKEQKTNERKVLEQR
jgi:hypothetical protein